MIAFWTEANHAPPKTQVFERNVHTQRGTSIKRMCVLHKCEYCYVVCKCATPTPKTNRNSNVGDYGLSMHANCSACSERSKQLAKTPAGFPISQHSSTLNPTTRFLSTGLKTSRYQPQVACGKFDSYDIIKLDLEKSNRITQRNEPLLLSFPFFCTMRTLMSLLSHQTSRYERIERANFLNAGLIYKWCASVLGSP